MNNFSQFIRHIWLINTRIVVYTCKKLICMAKGDKLKPSFNMKMVYEYMEDIKEGKRLKPMPMGAYEYSCCVKYLKKIKSLLKTSREDFHSLVLEFGEKDKHSIVITPLEDCLEKVAEEVGFKLTSEEIGSEKYVYTFQSTFA